MGGAKPAARLTDLHSCPMTDGPVPHAGGPVITGSFNVFINGLPAARLGDTAMCVGPTDTIVSGSGTVLINGRPAARVGDRTAHGGMIILGSPNVLIGDSSPVPDLPGVDLLTEATTLRAAAASGKPFCAICQGK